MLIGVPKEIKNNEYRVGLTPAGVRELKLHGHSIVVETHAGHGIGLDNEHFERAGAEIVETAAEIFDRAELVVKVKEPQKAECAMLREGQILFTYLHLAPDPKQTQAADRVRDRGAIAYETVTDAQGGLPLLSPMSEVAGRMAIQAGAHCLEKPARRTWCAARRRAGRAGGQGRGHRRRCGRHQRDPHGHGPGSPCHRHR